MAMIEDRLPAAEALLLGTLLACGAQCMAQAASIDPALLAKATGGDAAAQVAVGDQYTQAAAAARDRTQIAADQLQELAWFRKAAEQNYLPGEMRLAALYRDGAGRAVARDPAQAAAWYRKAADQGDTSAQATLGLLYSLGLGVPHDDVEAYFWMDLAASAKGPEQAKYAANRQAIGERITEDELASVEDRVTAWKAAHPRSGGKD